MGLSNRISRSKVISRFLTVLALGGLIASCHTPLQPTVYRTHPDRNGPARGPNILLIIGDDHAGGTLGIDGDPRRATPCLDRLATQGVRFDRAFCNAPLCTPSRQTLITGRLPHATGVSRLTSKLPETETTIGDWLGDIGYDTAAYGKMHFNREDLKHGFQDRLDVADYARYLKSHPPKGGDHRVPWHPFKDPASVWLNAEGRSSGLPRESMDSAYFVDRATEFFQGRIGRKEPFLMVVGLYEPHSPFKFPDGWPKVFRPEEFTVPPVSKSDLLEMPKVFAGLKPKEIQGIQAAYFTAISYVDAEIGRLVDALDASGLAEDTIVVYLGDNGYMRGDHGRFEKHCLYEPAVRVPLIFRWKGHLPEGRRVTEMVELVDVLPTLFQLSEQPAPPNLHGRSFVDPLKGKTNAKGRSVVFSEYLEDEEAMVRSERYKLIVGTGSRRRQDGYDTGRPLPGPYEKLFDLQTDPGEASNLIEKPELSGIRQDLEARLLDRLAHTRNPDDQVPATLNGLQAIHWCLRPRD